MIEVGLVVFLSTVVCWIGDEIIVDENELAEWVILVTHYLANDFIRDGRMHVLSHPDDGAETPLKIRVHGNGARRPRHCSRLLQNAAIQLGASGFCLHLILFFDEAL